MSKIQTPEEFERWWCSINGTSLAAAIASRDAQIRAEAAEEKRLEVVAEIDSLTQYGLKWSDSVREIRGELAIPTADIKRIASLQPHKPSRDPRALEVAHSIAERFHIHGCDDIADLLAANVKEWREK